MWEFSGFTVDLMGRFGFYEGMTTETEAPWNNYEVCTRR
ncbi:hypothetical protein B194_2040 [Serratia plymuthica A30]|nr:hypothetical protein B194_2040 [Serratia plymuthica A30]